MFQRADGDVILAAQIGQQGMCGRIASWWSLEAFAGLLETLAKCLALASPFPLAGMRVDRSTNFRQGLGIGPPDSHPEKGFVGGNMKIESGSVHIAAGFMAELDAYVGFVGPLVFCKIERLASEANGCPMPPSACEGCHVLNRST